MSSVQVGRNSLCPCGSGKKSKKCCARGPSAYRAPGTPLPEEAFQYAESLTQSHNSKSSTASASTPPETDPKRVPPGKIEAGPRREIESTPEHPFFVYGKGWTPLKEVKPGDWLRTADGWTLVHSVTDPGEQKPVYNLRVADHNTYFVGTPEWGFAVWAHNRYKELIDALMKEPLIRDRTSWEALHADPALRRVYKEHGKDANFADRVVDVLKAEGYLEPSEKLYYPTTEVIAEAGRTPHGNEFRALERSASTESEHLPTDPQAIALTKQIDRLVEAKVTGADRLYGNLRSFTERRGLPFHLERLQHYGEQVAEIERPSIDPLDSTKHTGRIDIALKDNTVIDTKAWTEEFMKTRSAEDQRSIANKFQTQMEKYLDDPRGFKLRIEFKYDVPTLIQERINRLQADPRYTDRVEVLSNIGRPARPAGK